MNKFVLLFITITIGVFFVSCGSSKNVYIKKKEVVKKEVVKKKKEIEYDFSNLKLIKKITLDKNANVINIFTINKNIYVVNGAGHIKVLDLNGREINKFKILRNASAVSYNKDYIFIGSENGFINIYNIHTGKIYDKLKVKRYVTSSLFFNKSFYYTLDNGKINKYNIDSKLTREVHRLKRNDYVTVIQDYKNKLYFATLNGKVYKYESHSTTLNKIFNTNRYIFDMQFYNNEIFICRESGSFTKFNYLLNKSTTKKIVKYDDLINTFVNKYNILLVTSDFDFVILNSESKKIKFFKGEGADIVSMTISDNTVILSDGTSLYIYK